MRTTKERFESGSPPDLKELKNENKKVLSRLNEVSNVIIAKENVIKDLEKELISLRREREKIVAGIKSYENEYKRVVEQLEHEIENRMELENELREAIETIKRFERKFEKSINNEKNDLLDTVFIYSVSLVVIFASIITIIKFIKGL